MPPAGASIAARGFRVVISFWVEGDVRYLLRLRYRIHRFLSRNKLWWIDTKWLPESGPPESEGEAP